MSTVETAIEKIKNWEYQTSDTVMLTYSQKHTVIFPEEFLAKMYLKLKQEKIMGRLYPGMDMTHMNKFVSYMSNVKGLVICCMKTPTKPHPIGMGWLCEVDGVDGARRGSLGFAFFKEAWGSVQSINLSFMMLHYWFSCLNIDILYATTLKSNRLALRYSSHFGFRYLSEMPMFFSGPAGLMDAELICLKRKDFLPRYSAWRAKVNEQRSEPEHPEHAVADYAGPARS